MSATSLQSLATIAGGLTRKSRSGSPNPTGQPVRRSSKEKGTFEEGFYIVRDNADLNLQVDALDATVAKARVLRRRERAGESLTASERKIARMMRSALDVFRIVTDLARTCFGKVFPTYEHMAEKTGYDRSTIARALSMLEGIGMIERQRRFVKVPGEGSKPQYRQTSSVYRTFLPKIILNLLPRWKRSPPISADLANHAAEQQAEAERMLRSATCVQHVTYVAPVSDDLRSILLRMAANVDERESHYPSEPL